MSIYYRIRLLYDSIARTLYFALLTIVMSTLMALRLALTPQ